MSLSLERQPLLNKKLVLTEPNRIYSERDQGLDVFRGLCIILMILGKDQGNWSVSCKGMHP